VLARPTTGALSQELIPGDEMRYLLEAAFL
jgi:hypothetical protein